MVPETAFPQFAILAAPARLHVTPGAPMPKVHVAAWNILLDDTEQFLRQHKATNWENDAQRWRTQLETEFEEDRHLFGDMPQSLAERATGKIRQLHQRMAMHGLPVKPVDPRHFSWPVAPLIVSSPYGSRVHPLLNEPRFHAGIDLQVPLAYPVYAAETGTVVFSGWNGAHGKQIEIQHDLHWATRYSHLNALLVCPGAVVQKGQLIGLAGDTGMTTGPHVHFELRRDGEALDPEFFLELPKSSPTLISERS